LRGGFWRHFLVKYPEANHLHRRVARTSRRVANMPPGNSQDAAREHIWAAQCSCGYWHGIFGGVYLHHIRSANYANLLAADDILAAGDPQPAAAIEDVDMDGQSELTACCSPFYLHFDLARGGTLREWSHVPGRCNMVNVMTRREEAYHENLREAAAHGRVITPQMALWRGVETIHGHAVKVKEPGLETLLFQDWYRRGSFIDHFLRDDATCPGFYANRYPEEGDFVNLSYEGSWECRGAGLKVTLSRQGHVWVDGDFLPVRVAKTFTLRRGESTVDVLYQIQNLSAKPVVGRFGVETCTGLRGRVELASEWHPVLEVAEHNDVSHYLFQSSASDALRRVPGENIAGPETAAACALPTSVEVQMRLSHPSALWRFPLEPVVQSEGGFERAYQGVVFLHLWPIHLEPYAFWEVSFDIRVSLQRP
jgi:alpha-amylase